MSITTWFIIAVIILSILSALIKTKYKKTKIYKRPESRAQKKPELIKSVEKPKKRKILTRGEYKMYFVLKKALPEFVILMQVSFAVLLEAKAKPVINTFLQKRADFVICDEALNVVAIIELDGWSHHGCEQKDAERDHLLTNAGYVVIHYKEIPEAENARKDILLIKENAAKPRIVGMNETGLSNA